MLPVGVALLPTGTLTRSLGKWLSGLGESLGGYPVDRLHERLVGSPPRGGFEAAIEAVPGVAGCAVIGVPHADFGEAVVAIVAPKPGSQLDEKQIQSAITSDLAKYKQPKRVFVTTDIPRNAMGKIQKKDLRETYNATFRTT